MLTNARAREAKPRATRYEMTCDALPGFILRVLPTGKKVFFIRHRGADGKDRRVRLGPLGPSLGVEDARRAALAVLAGEEPPPTQKPRPAAQEVEREAVPDRVAGPVYPVSPTLREFARRFESEHIDVYLKPGTAAHYRAALQRFILPAFGEHRLDQVSTADIQRLHNSLRAKPSLANYMRCVLSVMFAKAGEWELTVRRNPVALVRRFEERAVERFLTPDEREALERVLATAARIPGGRKGHIGCNGIWAIRLLALTGMRRDEIRDLRWEHVDWRQSLLRLPDSKTGKRDVVVSDEVIKILREIAETKGHPQRGLVVCSRNGQKLYSLVPSWRNVRQLAGIPDVRLHDLRHSVASDAIMNGVPLEVVGKMLGHRNYRTTQRYAHIADTVLRDAVNLTSKTIVRAASGESRENRKP